MDSTTLLALAGISGTLLGAAVGAGGTLGAARVSSRGQADMEEQKARLQVYSACATALLARRETADALLDAFREDSFDLAAAQALRSLPAAASSPMSGAVVTNQRHVTITGRGRSDEVS